MTRTVRLLAAALLAFALGVPAAANAADPMAIDAAIGRGVTQLDGVQLPDGSLGDRLAVRDSATAGEALRIARSGNPAIARIDGFLSPLDLDDVDDLSRVALGSPATGSASKLLAEQNGDGGFGLSGQYQSDALDTALALRALTSLGERDAARRAADRLMKFSGSGVWGNDGGDVALTSEALLALDAYIGRYGSSSAIDTTLAGAISWLGDAQQADGSWSTGSLATRNTALALAALASSPTGVARVTTGADALLAAQLPDGSWGDPYTTALAIRALHLASEAIERDRVAQLPDPSIRARDISANPPIVDSGGQVTITAKVGNVGVATASGVTAEFFLDDPASGAAPVASTNVPDIAPGAQASVDGTFAVNITRPRTRVYVVLRAPVGHDRDLANNSAYINLYVRGAHKSYTKTRDWPRPGRDIQHSGTTPNHLHPGIDPTPIWRTHADGAQTVAEGKVYFGDNSDMRAVDAKTGALAWTQTHSIYYGTDDRYRAPYYNQGYVFHANPGNAGAFAAKTGEYQFYGWGGWGGDIPVWGIETIPQEHGPDPTFVYLATYEFINQDGQHCQLEPWKDPAHSDGNHVWEGRGRNGTGGFGIMYLNHKCDGLPLAFASDGPRGFVSSGGYLTGFNVATGAGPNGESSTPLFDVKLPGLVRAPAAPLVDSLGQVITAGWEGTWPANTSPSGVQTTGKGRVVASDPTDGSTYWSFTTDARLDGSPVEYGGAIIVTDRSGRVYGLDQTTGALKWSWRATDYVPPAPDQQGKSGQTLAIAGHYLYVPHPDGKVYTLDARDGTEMSATPFSGRPYDLAIDDTNNALYVRTLDGYVGAYPTHELATQCGPDGTNAPPAPGDIDRVSFNPDGSQLTGAGAQFQRPAISANGRYVAYMAPTGEIHVRDLQTGQTRAIPATDQVNSKTQRLRKQSPVLSADGRYLGYLAETIGPLGDYMAMYVMDLQTGVTEPVLKTADGSAQNIMIDGTSDPTNLDNSPMAMSADGQKVAFASWTNGIVPSDNNGRRDVFIVDRATGARAQVSPVTPAAQQVDNGNAAISGDGRYVAFTSSANLTGTALSPLRNDNGSPFTFLYDTATGQLRPASINSSGQLVQGYSPSVSGDGRYVAFSSAAPTLLPAFMREPDWYGYAVDAFVFDRTSGQVDLTSVTDIGAHNHIASAKHAVMSSDGRYVTFQNTGLLVKGSTVYDKAQVISRDRTAGLTEQVSHNSWGVSGVGISTGPAISADGTRIAFVSTATDLVDNDTNNARDVFVYDRTKSGAVSGSGDSGTAGSCPGGGGGDDGSSTYSDLTVTADDIHPSALEQGQSGQVDVDVHNAGGGASEPTTVRLYDGDADHGTLIGEQSLAALPAGGAASLSFTWNPVGSAGQHTLTAQVDPDRAVFEQKLDNDEADKAVDVAAPRLDVSVAPDDQAYGANEAVHFATHLTNGSIAARDVRLVESIRDEDGDDVASVHDGQVPVGPNGDATVHDDWETQDTTPGRYTISAKLLNAVGDELASAESTFEVKPDVSAGLSLQTDELSYDSGATATIGALVSNQSANSTLSGSHVQLSLADPHGADAGHWDLPAGEVMQGRSALLNQDKSLRGLEPGTYHTSAKLLAADGSELAHAGGQFEVRSSADTGDGVRGSLTANPTDPRRFDTARFQYSVTDSGNADIPGATVRVRISDLDSGATLKTLDDSRTITRSAPATGSLSTMVDLAENRDYQASLHLVLADGSERPLDRAIIHVRPQRLYYGGSFDTSPRNRVLVWACAPGDEAAARAALGDTYATYVPGCGSADQGGFMRLLRSGNYNQFWLVGKHHPFERNVDDELAARVIQGDGLLVAGGDGSADPFNNGGTTSPLGAAFAGTLSTGTYALQFAAGSAFAGLDAQATSPAKVTTTQATAIATTSWGSGANAKTAITGTYNQFGQGKAVYLGAAPSAFADSSRATAVLGAAANVLLPGANVARAGGMARFELFIQGEAPGSPLELRTQLPAGLGVPQLPSDMTLASDLLTTPFETAGTQRKTRALWLRLPTSASSASTSSTVHYRDSADGQVKQYGIPVSSRVDITENKATARDAALAALAGLGNLGQGDQTKVQKITDDVSAAAQATTDTTVLWNRLRALIDDIGTLERSRWSNIPPARLAVARLVTYVQSDYYLAGGN